MYFEEIVNLIDNYEFLKTVIVETKKEKQNKENKEKINKAEQEQKKIKFLLEKEQKILDLIIKANNNNIDFKIENGTDNTTHLFFKNKEDKYDYYYFVLENCLEYELQEVDYFINRVIEDRLEKEREEQIKLNALNKLTNEEKRLLKLI